MSAHDWDEIPYTDRFNPALPWGYWLVAQGELDGLPPLTDHTGQRWRSVREYFWVSRLAMAPIPRDDVRNEELEFMLATLVSLDRRVIPTEERALDLFGSWDRSRHYLSWLAGQKLLMSQTVADPNAELSPEGHAVLLMLASTRSPDAAPLAIGLPTLKSFHGLGDTPDQEERDRLIAAQERATLHLQYRFGRKDIAGQPAIVLAGVGLGPNIPLTRVLWSISFADDYARDRMLFWLHERIDRWPDWGELAYRQGARALSERLMQLAFADRRIGGG
ncbi:hypothetical protein F7D01_04750 [Erythrobacter sp. 3-20A1M]|uniref:hypothetical protein n=1 Tax=Erythrobacter sp. 3-20A1M TaxID=2653850 RepID=UPI001BFCBF15|nr:hypothetical protein [Erythrobacter sp. 3-20A1M]QWC56493.1 hypothetical protein F7D01_04750 [Erythrobacter sp. 3-20A1M]